MRVTKLALCAAATLVAWMSGAVAHGFPYVVKKGETVAELAERLYGRIELERIVIAANGLGDAGARGIVAGMRLEIPAAGYHKMAAGESWRSVASELLGASHRGDVLARLNDAEPWVPAVLGREIVVPYNLRYVASSGDTTESVAYRFMGRRDDGFLVASYNELHRASLAQGQVVLVPLVKLGLSEAGRVLASSAGAWIRSEAGGAARKSQDDAEPELARFTTMLRRGDYVSGVVTGARLLARGTLTAPQEARVHALLTEAFAALDERGLAADACAAWRAGEPGLVLDPVMLSPKIVAACLEPGRPSRSGADDRAKP